MIEFVRRCARLLCCLTDHRFLFALIPILDHPHILFVLPAGGAGEFDFLVYILFIRVQIGLAVGMSIVTFSRQPVKGRPPSAVTGVRFPLSSASGSGDLNIRRNLTRTIFRRLPVLQKILNRAEKNQATIPH